MNKIINITHMSLLSIIFVMITIYLFSITYSNIRYYKHYVDGVIIDKKTEHSSSFQTKGYSNFRYQILTHQGDTLWSSSHLKDDFNIKDQVEGRLITKKSMKILTVNGKKTQSDYDFVDLLSILFCTTILIIPILIILKNKK